jgi:hypothetical protein
VCCLLLIGLDCNVPPAVNKLHLRHALCQLCVFFLQLQVQKLQPGQIAALLAAQELNWDVQVDAEGHPYINLCEDMPR